MSLKKRLAFLAFALLMSLPRAAAAAFEPARDAGETARCFATFMNLSHAANGLPSAPERQRLMAEAVALRRLIGPFVDAAAEKIGSQAFYHRAVLAGRADMASLPTSGLNSPEAMGEALAKRARFCEEKIKSWGPPPASKPAADDIGAAIARQARHSQN
jgi:hypothetical protein